MFDMSPLSRKIHVVKKLLFIIFLVLCICPPLSYGAKPLAVIIPLRDNSPGGEMSSRMVANHLYNILNTTGAVSPADPSALGDQLLKFGVQGEAAELGFARSAGASLVLRGNIVKRKGGMLLELYAYGLDVPHSGCMIYQYSALIPLAGKYDSRELSYICEEHAGRFLSGIFRTWRSTIRLTREGDSSTFSDAPDGRYQVFRQKEGTVPEKISSVEIRNGVIVESEERNHLEVGDIIFVTHEKEAIFLSEFYYGRKREIVLGSTHVEDTLFTMLLTAPSAALMPVAAPVLGYYRFGDWAGLGLWTINAAPYLFIEGRGIFNDPDDERKHHARISSGLRAERAFAWYFGLAGGAALFVDAFSHTYLKEASDYHGKQEYMGNRATAIYLSLVSGGGGHFYTGHRFWGYTYFHLTNALMYWTLRAMLPGQHYNNSTHSYQTDSINRRNAALLFTSLGIVKTVEIIHLLYQRDAIDNGSVRDSFEPHVSMDEKQGLITGLCFTGHF